LSNIKYFHDTNYDVKKDAFPYQIDAFNEIKDLPYSAIFHEQGLGKTKIAIDLMLYWLEKKNIDSCFVVTKKQLIANWKKELNFHTFIKPKVLTSDEKNNFFILNSTSRVVLTNFETITKEKERLILYLKTRNVAIVIDESTKIKNPESKITKDFFSISSLFKIRTIMTGTPVANRPYDIWAQIYFLDQGKSLGTNFLKFKSETDLSNDLNDNFEKKMIFEKCVSGIFKSIKSFAIRETKDSGIISLPSKNIIEVLCDFENEQKDMYLKLKNECNMLLKKGDKTIFEENDISLKRLLRFIQIASNPRLVNDQYDCESGKEKALKNLIETIIRRSEKVIVWSIFIENVDYLTLKYKNYHPVKIHGNLSMDERNRAVELFMNDSNCKILFATPQSAKEGLTLTAANNVIFYDRGFNLDDYLQAQDRIHRISQTKECNIYNIILKDSIDKWIDILLKAKHNAAHLTQGDYKLAKYTENMDYTYGEMIKDILESKEENYGK